MKLFQKLFSAEAKEVPLSEKIASVESKTADELDAAVLGRGPFGDDHELRSALIDRASRQALLVLITDPQQGAEFVSRARKIYSARLDAGKITVDEFKGDFGEVSQQLVIASLCNDEALHLSILDSIQDEKLLEDICLASGSAKVRQLIVERITTFDALKRLAKTLKTKDKNAYRIIKTKLDAVKEVQQQQDALVARAKKIIEDLESLFHREVDAEFVSRFERVNRRLQELQSEEEVSLPADIAQAYNQIKEKCAAKIDQYKDVLEQEALRKQEQEAAKNQLEGVNQNLVQLLAKLFELEQFDERTQIEYRRLLDSEKESWDAAKGSAKPEKSTQKEFTKFCELIETIFEHYCNKGTLLACRNRVFSREGDDENFQSDLKYLRSLLSLVSSDRPLKTLNSIERVADVISRIDEEKKNEKEKREKAGKIVGSLIRKSMIAVEQGRIKQALGIRHSIDEKIEDLSVGSEMFAKRLEELDEAIQKLVDWQAYAVVPKKEMLIEAMEKLVGLQETPEALATKIKKLQDEWKGLSQSGKDRGEALWEKFSALAEQAYAPCKVYYEDLSSLRKQNLEKRQKLVQQLEDFLAQYDWEKADWKHVEQIIRASRKELHSYSPVERVANKTVNQDFDAAYDKLQKKLDDEFAKNKSAKEVLIEQATKLTELSDVQQATDGVKRLQAQWKTIGRCHYRDNDVLWKSFRVHCDAVFEKKSEKDTARRAAQDAVIEQARTILTKFEKLLELDGDELLAARNERDALQQAFTEVEEMPEKVQRAIERDFNKLLNTFEDRVQKVKNRVNEQAWETFFDLNKKVSDYQKFTWQQDENAAPEKEKLEAVIQTVEHWPEGGLQIIKQKLSRVSSKAEAEESNKSLRLLCVRAEILTDQDTPQEDKGLRMEYQVEMLQKGFGGGANVATGRPELAKEWCSVGPIESDTEYETLFKRFYANWKKLN